MPLGDEILKKYGKEDTTFASHMIGIAKQLSISNMQDRMDKNSQARAWALFEQYTGRTSKSEGTHGGKDIAFAQFVSSAWENWRRG